MKKYLCFFIIVLTFPIHISAQSIFGNGVNSTVYMTPLAIASGDFNKDGLADIVVSGKNDLDGTGIMTVLFGKGDGGFKNKIDLVTDKYAAGLLAVDMDNDGYPDIVTANKESQTVSVFINQKTGSFKAKDPIRIKGNPDFIGVGDFTKDSKPDIAVIVAATKELQIYKGTSYKLAATRTLEATPVAVAVKDLAGNGLSHVLVSYEGISNLSLIAPVEISSNKWDFSTVKLDMLTTPFFAQLGDVNGDGYDDAVILDDAKKEMVLYKTQSYGLILNDIQTFKIPEGTTAFTLGDFNKDKKMDIAVLDAANTQVTIFLNQTAGEFINSFIDAQLAVIYENNSSKPNSFDMGMMSSYKNASMIIYAPNGKPVRKYFEFESDLPDGQQFALEWNGLDEHDVEMSAGTYVFYYKLGRLVIARVVKK